MRCATLPRHLGKQIARALIADRVLDKKNVGGGGQEVTAAQALLTTIQTSLTLAQFKMFAICKINTPKAKRVAAELLAATTCPFRVLTPQARYAM
jgi:hypothetical protein